MPVTRETLSTLPLLQGLAAPTLDKLAAEMSLRLYEPQQIVFNKGSAGDCLAFLLSGRLQVVDISEDGRAVGIYLFSPGEYFGELAVIDGGPRSTSVVAVAPSTVALLPVAQARELIANEPLVSQRVMQRLARAVRASSHQITMLSMPNAYQRVYAQLGQFVRQTSKGQVMDQLPRQQDIAIMVNTSRETVSRALHMLLKMKVITKEGNTLIVTRPLVLQQAALDGLDAVLSRDAAADAKSSPGVPPRSK
jgi:CRP-like cAMP-binding protein